MPVASGARMASFASFSRRSLRVDVRASRARRRAGSFAPRRFLVVPPRATASAPGASSSSSGDDGSAVDVAVLGGGAAGLTAAYFAAKRGASVRVYERTRECGKKILMSGGARCNVLPVAARVEDFVTESPPRLMKNVLASWSVDRCRAWLEDDLGLELGVEHVTNKYFPKSNSSREVRDRLLRACEDAGVEFRYEASVEALLRRADDPSDPPGDPSDSSDPSRRPWWGLRLRDAPEESARSVVLAMGGLSFPAVGTDGTGYAIARRDLGHDLHEPYPALVPLTGDHPGGERLPGVSVDVALECKENAAQTEPAAGGKKKKKKAKTRKASREGFLFTHRGFSGPSVLDLSHHLVRPLARGRTNEEKEEEEGKEVSPLPSLVVNWSGESREVWSERLTSPPGRALVSTRLRDGLPSRLADALLAEARVDAATRVADLKKTDRTALLETLTRYEVAVDGHQGYRKAEVTGGGVRLDEMETGTMESKTSPGVFFCGEVCDVFGRIGGFNFLWAWTSGRLAGMSAAERAAGGG